MRSGIADQHYHQKHWGQIHNGPRNACLFDDTRCESREENGLQGPQPEKSVATIWLHQQKNDRPVASHKIAAVDTKTGKLAALIDTKKIPHPGRGANFVHPQYGPVWATGHLGDAVVTLISTPSDKKENAKYKGNNWKVVQELKMPGAGNLFVKTHPKSRNLWADAPQNPEREVAESVYVYDMKDLSKAPRQVNVAKDSGLPESKAIRRAVHPEYDQSGTEVWISLWGGKTDQSAIVVYDDKTLKVKKVITDPKMITPTENRSARAVTGLPAACSGAMYCGVPA